MNTEDFEIRNRKSLINENNNIEQDTETLKNIYENKELNSEGFESDEERLIDDKLIENVKKSVPQSKDELSFLNELLNKLPSKWKNYIIRTIFTLFMVLGFLAFIYIGPLALALVTIFVQVKCFQEIISVGYAVYKVHGLPWFRSLSWYFLVTSNYFFYGESFSKSDFFDVFFKNNRFLYVLVKYHRFISFSLYIIGILWFVLSLKKRYYMRQFSLFAWTHVTLLIVVTQSYLILQNLFQGLIWFIVPVSMIVINDVMAYLFGFFFGKTPLIKLSPKKTWEGFIGGGFSTIILGAILSHFLCKYSYLVCPVEYTFTNGFAELECNPSHLFKLTEYKLSPSIASFLKIFNMSQTITLYPFVLHSLALSTFSSLIAPFGGFFASGFKRAFKIKDFGDMIPGHGGIMDRFDCQFLMATFVNVYISSFISAPNPDRLLQQIYQLKLEHQIVIFETLKRTFEEHGLSLNCEFQII